MAKIHPITLVALFGLSLFTGKGWGQDAPNLLSPQTRDFFHTVSHYTGTVNMSIPLYTYKDKDFEIPINLSYNATGFIPSKREGPVGLNWALNAGGAVVRKVNGLPDDCSGKNEQGERVSPMGIWIGAKNRKLANLDKQDIFELKVGEAKDGYWTANDVELTPDEFTFVAPGLSGWFYINFDGTVKCAGNKPFVVELGGLGEQLAKGANTASYSTITITADNGYQYLFGGGDAEKEWSVNYPKDTKNAVVVITAWHLKEIIAPNGRSVIYQYRPYNFGTDYLYNAYFEQSGKVDECEELSQAVIDGWKITNVESISKTVYLQKIGIGSTAIQFDYLENSRKFYTVNNSINAEYNQENLSVDKMKVSYGQDKVAEFQFVYDYLGKGYSGQRLFLTSVAEQGERPYNFTYYIPDVAFPSPRTKGIDHWGFWNGKDRNKSLIPAATNVKYSPQYTGVLRDPDAVYANAGLLASIAYPAGGKTTFLYEPHQYSWLVGNPWLTRGKMSGMAGGARIAAVESTDGKLTYRVQYEYPSGGVLMHWPVYVAAYEEERVEYTGFLSWESVTRVVFKGKAASYATNSYPGEPVIHYPEVVERRGTGHGAVKYVYSNYNTHPDVTVVARKRHPNVEDMFFNTLSTISLRPSSRYFERGLLTNMQAYDANNRLKAQQYFEYSDINDYSNEWIPSVAIGEFEASSFKIYHNPIVLQRKTVTQYFDGDSVVTVMDYDYHNRKDTYPVSLTTTASDGAELKTEYRYIDGWRDNAEYAALRDRNIRNIPVETIHYKNGAVVGASLVNFNFFDDLTDWNVYPSEVLQLEAKAPVTDFDSVNVDQRMKPRVTYERYDNYGNVLQQRGVDGLTVSYLWDKSGLYKLAEAVGATYDELQEAATGMDLEVPATDYLQQLHQLREQLPQALMTNYTYKPLVGITSQTDANGLTTYYEYDELNRLKRVRDHEGMVLKEYEVHYFEDGQNSLELGHDREGMVLKEIEK